MSEDGGDFLNLGHTDGKTTKLKVKDLTAGLQYVFHVSAVNKVGTSKPLESEAVVPKRPPGSVFVFFIFHFVPFLFSKNAFVNCAGQTQVAICL